MDQFSKEFKNALTKLLQIWEKEKGDYEELHITPTEVIVERYDRMDIIEIDRTTDHRTIVESCQQDLQHLENVNYRPPVYINGNDDDRLPILIRMLHQNEIKRKSANDRLEFYYYLGQTLAYRGWLKKDSKLIQQSLGERTHREIKKLAKRTFELFNARGISIMTQLMYIKPTHLAQMTEGDFYDHLLPEARRLKQIGLISE